MSFYPAFRERERQVTPVGVRSRTKQSFRNETDVNVIVRKYMESGDRALLEQRVAPRYGDFSSGGDFHAALSRVRQAEALFEALPAAVRDYVDNDPRKFLDLVHDPERRDECVELGLIPEVAGGGSEPSTGGEGSSGVAGAAAKAAEKVVTTSGATQAKTAGTGSSGEGPPAS